MGHSIKVVIGKPAVVERIAKVAGCPQPTELPFGLVTAPLGERQIDKLTALQPGLYLEGFYYLSQGLRDALVAAAESDAFAYVETEYFGGMGSQGAAFFDQGRMVMNASEKDEPTSHDSPINTVLRALGVKAERGQDEFNALGLGHFRNNEALGLEEYDA